MPIRSEQQLETTSVAYEARTHFLNPRGDESRATTTVRRPTLNAASVQRKLPDVPNKHEVAWVDFNRNRFDTSPEAGPRNFLGSDTVGTLHLATMWRDGEYTFASVEELMSSTELPIYTMEWLVRFINNDRRKRVSDRHGPNALYGLFFKNRTVGKIIAEARERNREGLDLEKDHEVQARLARQAIEEHPHLAERFAERGMIVE